MQGRTYVCSREENMSVAQKPGRFIGRNLPTGESAERELDRFISSRHEKRVATEGERTVEEAWKASEGREEGRRRAEEGHARLVWAKHLRGVYAARKEEYERLVETLEGTDRKEAP
jgi:hypothetical protein